MCGWTVEKESLSLIISKRIGDGGRGGGTENIDLFIDYLAFLRSNDSAELFRNGIL
jgi:hypothetical protein